MNRVMKFLKPALLLAVLIISFAGAAEASAQGAAAPGVEAAQQEVVHIVQRGETLYSIAQRYGTTVAAIQTANGLSGTLIYVGQRLVIPSGTPGNLEVYRVVAGDTLFRIAQQHGTTVAAIRAANGWGPTYSTIYPGQHVFVPTGASAGTRNYVVRRGDTLYSLARRFSTSVAAIQTANNLTGAAIYTGQALKVPAVGGLTYTVQRGDYLNRIAARYGVSTAALAARNGITNANLIHPGQVLVIP